MSKYFLWNPLDVKVSIPLKLDENTEVLLEAPPQKISEFENEYAFNHIREHLIDLVVNDRSLVGFDDVRNTIRDEITKDI